MIGGVCTFNNVLYMTTTCSSLPLRSVFVPPSEDFSILPQGVRRVIWPNGEDGRQTELQLLASHGLKCDFKVERADRNSRVLLPWVYEGLLDDVNVFYATASDDKV